MLTLIQSLWMCVTAWLTQKKIEWKNKIVERCAENSMYMESTSTSTTEILCKLWAALPYSSQHHTFIIDSFFLLISSAASFRFSIRLKSDDREPMPNTFFFSLFRHAVLRMYFINVDTFSSIHISHGEPSGQTRTFGLICLHRDLRI